MTKLIASRMVSRNGRHHVDFVHEYGHSPPFSTTGAEETAAQWMDRVGIDPADRIIRWQSISFTHESDAMLCYLRFA